jgi:hypothetical protein
VFGGSAIGFLKKDFCKLMFDHQTITMDGCETVHPSGPAGSWLSWRPGGSSVIFGRSDFGEKTRGARKEQ